MHLFWRDLVRIVSSVSFVAITLCATSVASAATADRPNILSASSLVLAADFVPAKPGPVLFVDDFNRAEIGPRWETNDARRGVSGQSRLVDGALAMKTSPKAGHGAVITTAVAYRDAALEFRFKFDGPDGFKFVINDDACKTVHAGHIARVNVTVGKITLQDDKTGTMNLIVRERIAKEGRTPEIAQLLAPTSVALPASVRLGEWHLLRVEIRGDEMRVALDGIPVGSLRSPGFAHATKSAVAFNANLSDVRLDDLKVWALK